MGQGEIIFTGPETTSGGNNAINFQSATFAGNDEVFLSIPLSEVANGNYDWVRVSLAYQEGDINFKAANGNDYSGTLASFVGYNTYITSFNLNGSTFNVNANRLQGFWAFSINNSFEWTEVNFDGKYEPTAGEQVVDMGLRGLIPIVEN